jgi:hypothetical protein
MLLYLKEYNVHVPSHVPQNNFHDVDIISNFADSKVLAHWPIIFNILEDYNYHFKNTRNPNNTAVTPNKITRVS